MGSACSSANTPYSFDLIQKDEIFSRRARLTSKSQIPALKVMMGTIDMSNEVGFECPDLKLVE